MTNSERLTSLIRERGLNVKVVAERAGIPYTTLKSMIDRGMKNPSIVHAIKVAEVLGVQVADFIEEARTKNDVFKEDSPKYELFKKTPHNMSMRKIEYRGPVSAGERTSIVCEDSKETIELPSFLLNKYAHRKDIHVLKTNGDSMDKIIPDGSYVICIPVESKDDLKNGDIVIYKYNNESSMKRYHQKQNHIVFSPESNNNDYFDFVIPKDTINEVKIESKVISYHVVLS